MQSHCSISAVTEDAEATQALLTDRAMARPAVSPQEEGGKVSRKEKLEEDRVEYRVMSLL